jgi:hypothetical protein
LWQVHTRQANSFLPLNQKTNGTTVISNDLGTTWTATSAPNESWLTIASSADGNTLIAGAANGGLYVLHAACKPRLNLDLTSNQFMHSWMIPSTNFGLWQNPGLTPANWSIVTNSPVLNLTNLQNQMVLPLINGGAFYRLATH